MLADTGALAHCFDGWEDHEQMWRSTGDQSSSFISAAPAFTSGIIPIFHPDGAGVIYRPGVARIRCGKGGDSGGHCGGFCPSVGWDDPDVRYWDYPGDGCGGSWAPWDMGVYLRRQAAWQVRNHRLQYNEVIVDGDDATRRLPWSIAAFFFASGGGAEWQAREQHRHFLAAYPELSPADVPLVALNLGDWQNPFGAAG